VLKFEKYNGSGNEFIIIDNRYRVINVDVQKFVKKICERRISVGADGALLLENSVVADFKMRIINSDGSEAEMCGNGARCIAMYAYKNGIVGKSMTFETLAGIMSAEIINKNIVKVKLSEPFDYKDNIKLKLSDQTISNAAFINTNVPHAIIFHNKSDFDKMDILPSGREIRNHKTFAPAGTNVNFVKTAKDNSIYIRTYERGVEDETLACGTGSTAAAIITAIKFGYKSPVKVITRSKIILKIHFNQQKISEIIKNNISDETSFDVFLEGPVKSVYSAELLE
jgi:diaminopimelate epimerase